MNLNQITGHLIDWIPFVGITGELTQKIYGRLVVASIIVSITTIGGGYIAGRVSAAQNKIEFEWIKKDLVDARHDREKNSDAISKVNDNLDAFKIQVYRMSR